MQLAHAVRVGSNELLCLICNLARNKMPPMRKPKFHEEIVRLHSSHSVSKHLIIALQVSRKYRRRPDVQQLMRDFGMSRATAFRWRAAWQYVADNLANET